MAGVYISYPFCNQKCSFCNFASGVSPQRDIQNYQQSLLTEIRAHAWQWQPETLYFGGGTPSLMPLDSLQQIMAAIPREKLCEVTLECAPGGLTLEQAEAWRACGVNRVSLGVQSFVTNELRQTGRRHNKEIVQHEVELLRRAELSNINIDLIAGLPGQTEASMDESIDWIQRLNPTHVSLYIFEVDEDSRLGNEILLGGKRYGALQVPDDDVTARIFSRASAQLKRLGYHHYEISNFAKTGHESRHNLKYWLLEPYIGFGLDAHSFDGSERWSNPDVLQDYFCESAEKARRTPTDHGEERFFVGLRLLDGMQPTAEEWRRFAQPIEKWLNAGMLEREGPMLRLKPEAVLVSNEIFQEFLGR